MQGGGWGVFNWSCRVQGTKQSDGILLDDVICKHRSPPPWHLCISKSNWASFTKINFTSDMYKHLMMCSDIIVKKTF